MAYQEYLPSSQYVSEFDFSQYQTKHLPHTSTLYLEVRLRELSGKQSDLQEALRTQRINLSRVKTSFFGSKTIYEGSLGANGHYRLTSGLDRKLGEDKIVIDAMTDGGEDIFYPILNAVRNYISVRESSPERTI